MTIHVPTMLAKGVKHNWQTNTTSSHNGCTCQVISAQLPSVGLAQAYFHKYVYCWFCENIDVHTISELPNCIKMWLNARHTPDSCISMGHTNT